MPWHALQHCNAFLHASQHVVVYSLQQVSLEYPHSQKVTCAGGPASRALLEGATCFLLGGQAQGALIQLWLEGEVSFPQILHGTNEPKIRRWTPLTSASKGQAPFTLRI